MPFRVTSDSIQAGQEAEPLQHPQAGACATFEGWVRNHNEGQAVASLEYEAYAELAEAEGNRIMAEAVAKFDLLTAHAVHRPLPAFLLFSGRVRTRVLRTGRNRKLS